MLERIRKAKERLAVLNSENRVRDPDEIWEAYYDVEEAILMAKVVFHGFDRPGKMRKLPAYTGLSDEDVRAKISSAEDSLSLAEASLAKRAAEETIERLRKARDQLKAILLAGTLHPKSAKSSRKVRG